MKISNWLRTGLIATALLIPHPILAASGADDNSIYVVGALHSLHEREDSFTYEKLREIIERLNPDIMVLEVRPDELAELKDTPGRPEYPAVIWPMLKSDGPAAVAMEPGEEDFARMAGQASAAFKAFAEENPAGFDFLKRYRTAFEMALVSYWESPAQSHDGNTRDLVEGYKRVQFSFFHESGAENQAEWDGYMANIALEVALANPEKRILVLGSFRNRHVLEDALKNGVPARVVDTAAWLESIAY
ncbi:hypothetical protein [Kordiimonas sp.]|uniref:hypothetical protein n=1 Tax=Kordiimonas sp. TaxID=1970157 RepID=UPI003A939819